jgi:hypothetical protein
MSQGTTGAPRRTRTGPVQGLESFTHYGFVLGTQEDDPRDRPSGLPCPSSHLRVFANRHLLIDAFCWERRLHTRGQIAAALPTFGNRLHVRALDIIALSVVRIPASAGVCTLALDEGDRDLDPSWGIFRRRVAAVDGLHPGGVIVEDDARATSIFIALDALEAHTRIDHVEPVSIATLLAARAQLDPDALTPEAA